MTLPTTLTTEAQKALTAAVRATHSVIQNQRKVDEARDNRHLWVWRLRRRIPGAFVKDIEALLAETLKKRYGLDDEQLKLAGLGHDSIRRQVEKPPDHDELTIEERALLDG